MSARRFLFLQGLAGPMFTRLGDRLRAQGHAVQRVNFCAGDALAWRGRPAMDWREGLGAWPARFTALLDERAPTDLVLFGALRPLHRAVIPLARAAGVRVHAFEEGYVRPNWITVERLTERDTPWLPRDAHWYREVDRHLPRHDHDRPIQVPLQVRAAQELAHHLANAANPIAFPGYRTHRQHDAATESLGFVRRFATLPLRALADARRLEALLAGGAPFFMLPLQLDGDAQIVHHSPFGDIAEVIELVLRSFAAHAPAGTQLLVKNHPLDAGLHGHGRTVARLVRQFDLAGRVHYVETGHLPTLLGAARGTVVVNSTVGLSALSQGCPVKALARPIYDLPGLTHGHGLDLFWREPERPDAGLFAALRNTVIHASQVNGDFCTRGGIALAVDGCTRMLGERSPLEELLATFGRPADERAAVPVPLPGAREDAMR
jgi:capsular polysaccharide export protein